ncbi:MAG TPA: AMP-binding protein, partial [Burkholderiales bacterium]|nr:AMP-binding protein [Burkholderiales bacterium]
MTTVFTAFEQTARAHRDKPFLQVPAEDVELSYGEAHRRIDELAARYAKRGYGAGHRVALKLPNCSAFLLHFLALNSLGASAVPVNPDLRRAELDYVLGHSEAALLVDSPELAGFDPPRAPRPGNASECALLYTSGTTGRPKGCLLDNFYFL